MSRFDPKTFLERVGDGKTIAMHQPGAIIMKQGEPAAHVYYLQSGKATEVVTSDQGKEAVVGVLEAGLFFGAAALDGGGVRVSTVAAVTPCLVTAITKEAMIRALREPKFLQLFMAYLLHHNSKIEQEKVDLLFNSSEKLLAQKLLLLAHADDGKPERIGPEITQEMLASMIGTTRPRVNYFLRRFQKLGFIQYGDSGITVMPSLLKMVLQSTPMLRSPDGLME